LLLKALALVTMDRAAAALAIARLPANSPFERLAAVLRAAVLPDTQWLLALHNLDADSRQLLLDLKGCPDALRPLLIDLARLGEQPHPETWFDFLLRHRRSLPAGLAESLCQRLLPHAESRLKHYTDAFGRLAPARLEHLAALTFEAKHKRSLALPHWRRLAEMLTGDASQKQRAALIWRSLSGIDIAALGDEDVLADSINCLQRSVELDPDERETQLRLIAALRHQGELQQARGALDRALPRFPKDAALLLEAVQVALASKAFKKAVGLAKQVLEIDPINPTVRRLVGQAHFSHARKQIKANNLTAAGKELDAADAWLRDAEDFATLKLLRALTCDDTAADSRLREAVADLGDLAGQPAGKLAGAFHLALEAGRLGMNVTLLLKRAGVDLKAAGDTGAVVALARAVEAARENERTVRAALLPLHPVLKRAITGHFAGRFAEADLRVICEAWLRAKEYELLRHYADAALKHWPQRPVFVYFKAASYSDKLYRMPMQLQHQLERAGDASHAQNDRQTMQRIQRLFAEFDAAMDAVMGGPYLPPELDDFNGGMDIDIGEPGAAFEMLLQMGGEELLFKIARQAIGKAAFEALRKQMGGSDKEFARALIQVMTQEARASGMPMPPLMPPAPPRKPAPQKPVPLKPAQDIQRDLFDD
jgi:tetratricopeptide (TPR) repeat protein